MKVCILITQGLSLFELGCATELFALPRPEFADWYEVEMVSLSAPQQRVFNDLSISCRRMSHLPKADLLVIPYYAIDTTVVEPNIASEVLNHYANGGRIISFCSGAFLLAELGLLEGCEVTTHWRYKDAFMARFPHLNYKHDVLYSFDGRIGCSAGSASAIDLGIEVIRQDFGFECANAVARRLVLPAHRSGGQSQYVEKPIKLNKNVLTEVLDWAVSQLSPELTIDQIATRANMTRRTFDRQFKKTFNMTPLVWLNERKLEVAQQLLETTSLPLERVAQKAGFDNAITLRHNFHKYLSTSPSRYRDTFKNK